MPVITLRCHAFFWSLILNIIQKFYVLSSALKKFVIVRKKNWKMLTIPPITKLCAFSVSNLRSTWFIVISFRFDSFSLLFEPMLFWVFCYTFVPRMPGNKADDLMWYSWAIQTEMFVAYHTSSMKKEFDFHFYFTRFHCVHTWKVLPFISAKMGFWWGFFDNSNH